jgi:hypothetical protein
MASDFVEPKDSPEDQEPDVVGTPEGDNEFAPDEPLTKLPEGAEEIPRGSDPEDDPEPGHQSVP